MTENVFNADLPDKVTPKISKLLLGWLVSMGAVVGAFVALMVVFFAPRFFDIGHDPAISAAAQHDLAALRQQVVTLQENMQENGTVMGRAVQEKLQDLHTDITKQQQVTATLAEKIDTTAEKSQGENRTAMLLLGLTQLKTAWENDQPLQPGFNTLLNVTSDPVLQKELKDMVVATAHNLPSVVLMRKAIAELAKENATAATVTADNLTWQEKLKQTAGQFVRVQPSNAVTQNTVLQQIDQALATDDLSTASRLVKQLQPSERVNTLAQQIDARLNIQNKLKSLSTTLLTRAGIATTQGVY